MIAQNKVETTVPLAAPMAAAIQSLAAALMTCSKWPASASNWSPKFRPGSPGTLIEISVKAADILAKLLNFGDCFAYALAKTTGESLLFIGADFGHTDIMSAIA